MSLLIFLSAAVLLKNSDFTKKLHKKEYLYLTGLAIGNGMLLEQMLYGHFRVTGIGEQILWGMLAGGMLTAACMDAMECWVYNYVWWWCLACDITLLLLQKDFSRQRNLQQMISVVVFIVLQQVFFVRMYGRADGHAFCVCAMAEAVCGGKMVLFLLHMLLAVILLAFVQFCRGNITRRGRLRKPQPFIPYIVVSFWMVLWGYCDTVTTYIYA